MRYRVFDLPVQGLGAFTPTMTTNPASSSWGLVKLSGAPGTKPIPSPGATRHWAPTPNNAPKVQRSNCAPDVIFPDLYTPYATNMGPVADAGIGMATRRHTPLPVPATHFLRVPRVAMVPHKVGGRRAMAWPRAFQRYTNVAQPEK